MAGSQEHIAWAAGLFEGEGWISIRPQSGKNRGCLVRLGIQMTDLDVLQHFLASLSIDKEPYERRRLPANRKPIWCIEINRRDDVIRVLTLLMPYFGERRTMRAKEAMAYFEQYGYYYRGEREWQAAPST